ncbi:hypothetical protein ACN47E_001294 [Coniothyrium glycines]
MRSYTVLSALVASTVAQQTSVGFGRSSQSFDIEPTRVATSRGNAEPTVTDSVSGPIQSDRACAQIAEFVADDSSDISAVTAELAYACLRTVPIRQQEASGTVDAIKQMVEFQSTITYLKDPPQGWPNEAVDIMGGLDNIKSRVNNGEYSNEYDFENDIASLLVSAHDGHLNFNGMAYTGAFQWRRSSRIALISASRDGSSTPQVWAYSDFNQSDSSFEPSPITQIQGRDVVEFLEEEARLSSYHDPDTRYNAMFFMQAAENFGYFTNPRFYPGPTTTVVYENGTTQEYTNSAIVLQPTSWTFVTGPESFYETYIVPDTSAQRVKKRDPNALPMHLENPRDHDFQGSFSVKHGSVPVFYPEPVVAHSADLVPLAGYFVNTNEGEIGVLVVQTFNTEDVAGAVEFQAVVQDYISQAKSRGIERVIIDVRANGGGKILSGYDMYKQFFPSQAPQTQSRWRGSPASRVFGESLSSFESINFINAELFTSPFSNDAYVNTQLDEFATWSDMYPPERFHNDNFTALLKYNLSDPLTTSNERTAVGITITGYGSRDNYTTDPFRAEDLLILSDGICASTCSIFTELMTQQSGVRTLTVGGRPQPGPSVPVGGTKGTLVLPALYLHALSEYVLVQFASSTSQAAEWRTFVPQTFSIATVDASVNFQDNIRRGLETAGVPTQFLNDTSSCRIWYEPDMYFNVTRLWEKASSVAWGSNGALDEAQCVSGSVTSREAQTGRGGNNPSPEGNGGGNGDQEDGAVGMRPGWTGVLFCMGLMGWWVVM